MANWYVDPAATGAGDGTSWTDAFTTLQAAVDEATLAAGDSVYCRGTETLTAQVDFDGVDGTDEDRISFIGCDGSGTPGAANYKVTTADAIHGLVLSGMYYVELRFFEIESTALSGTYYGISESTTTYGWLIEDCIVHGWPSTNVNLGSSVRVTVLVNVESYGAGQLGFSSGYANVKFVGCVAHDNYYRGFSGTASLYYGCIAYKNSDSGFITAGQPTLVNCIADNNGADGFETSSGPMLFIGCRCTNNAGYGFHLYTGTYGVSRLIGCYAQNNTTANMQGAYQLISPGDDSTFNVTTGTDQDDAYATTSGLGGYVDGVNADYNLSASATLRSKALTLP